MIRHRVGRQAAANAVPQGSLIVAKGPLPPAIDQKLGSQAQARRSTNRAWLLS
jgi:hypothetical protein